MKVTNKKQIGREAELRFAAELTRQGWEIFLPWGRQSNRYPSPQIE